MLLTVLSGVLLLGCGAGEEGSGGAGDGSASTPATGAPSADERAICQRLQGLVDQVVAGEAEGSMRALHELEVAVGDSGPSQLRTEGEAFFTTIYGTVPDPGSLTPEESSQVGDDALRAAQPRIGSMLDTCARLGLPVQDLPTGPGRP
jgi:hypothetical protein